MDGEGGLGICKELSFAHAFIPEQVEGASGLIIINDTERNSFFSSLLQGLIIL
jgi:hypothetical protein